MERDQIQEAYDEVEDYLSGEYGDVSVDYEWFDEDHCWILFRSLGEEEDEFYELLEENNPGIHISEATGRERWDVEDLIQAYASVEELDEEEYHERGETQIRNQQTHSTLGPGFSPFED